MTELMFPEVEGLPGSNGWWDARWLVFRIVASGTNAKSRTYGEDKLMADWIRADVRTKGVRKSNVPRTIGKSNIGKMMVKAGIEPTLENYYQLRAACHRVDWSNE